MFGVAGVVDVVVVVEKAAVAVAVVAVAVLAVACDAHPVPVQILGLPYRRPPCYRTPSSCHDRASLFQPFQVQLLRFAQILSRWTTSSGSECLSLPGKALTDTDRLNALVLNLSERVRPVDFGEYLQIVSRVLKQGNKE